MLDLKGTESYWRTQTEKGDNPCHYHNYWQDTYAFLVRSRAFRASDLEHSKTIADIGCGVGDYTRVLATLSTARIIGFDFPFNIEIARKKNAHPRIEYREASVPDGDIAEAVKHADTVVTTTTYVHLSDDARAAFLSYVSSMQRGGKVLLLEYMPDEVPEFQKNLAYKRIETAAEVTASMNAHGFRLVETRHLNFIDSFLFFHLGRNVLSFVLTLAGDALLKAVRFRKSKYKLLVFIKERP